MNLTRKMMRHGKRLVSRGVTAPFDRPKALKKGTAYRRIIARDGRAIHATKGKGHPLAILDYRASLIAKALGVPVGALP